MTSPNISSRLPRPTKPGRRSKKFKTVREAIAKALEPLKDLRLLVAAETARSIAALGSKIKAILDRIHLRERLAYENASLGKKAVRVEGSFRARHADRRSARCQFVLAKGHPVAFVLALREQTIEGLTLIPFRWLSSMIRR